MLKWLSWLLVVGLLAWVLAQVPLREAAAIVAGLRGWQVGAGLAVNGLVLWILNGRWWLILRAQGYVVPYLRLLGHRLAGFGVSYFTPGPQFGGEPVQVLLLSRKEGVPRATAVAVITLDKLLELLFSFLFLVGGVLIVLQGRLFGGVVGWETAVFAFILLLFPAAFLTATGLGWYPVSKLLRGMGHWSMWARRPVWHSRYQRLAQFGMDSEAQMTAFFRTAPRTLLVVLAVSVCSWLLLLFEYALMLRFLGLTLTWMQVVGLLTAVRVAFLLPLPAGLGMVEASQVLALSLMGLNPAVGISASLLIRARDVLLGLAGLAWWRLNWG
ncbi:MAG: flippase-like domain-containing protein [Ardenticatenaceae bacterium]|nr:flippase-like domain-containing protein [Ardenticatenaceae bacterium]